MDSFDLYTDLIMEHSLNSPHKHALTGASCSSFGNNPSCGDEIKLEAKISNGKIQDLAFSGQGCAISQSSTSIMIDLIKGKSVDEAKKIISVFMKMIKEGKLTKKERELLGDALAFENIANMPARVKCALLAWHTFENLIN